MNLLNPWAVGVGAFAIALPIVIHILTRPRPVRFPLSTIRFINEVIRQQRARHRLRNFLILALRTLAVALLAWAFAKPLFGNRPLVSGSESGASTRVVILDQSQSMGAVVNGIETFERARPIASKYVSYRRDLKANLILAAAAPDAVMEFPSNNFSALREELEKAEVRPERLNTQSAIVAAAEMFSQAPGGSAPRRELVIISDFQRSNWVHADFSSLPDDVLIQLQSVAPSESPANLAILNVTSRNRAEDGKRVTIDIEVGNFSSAPRRVEVELTVGDSTERLDGMCFPGQPATIRAEVNAPSVGWQSGVAKLVGVQDAIVADNNRHFVLQVKPAATYALITRQPSDMAPSSSFYLECALDPHATGNRSGNRVLRIDPESVNRETLAAADLLVIDHPGKLSGDAIGLIGSLVRRGRALLYVAAEPVDAVNLTVLAKSIGSDLQLPVEFAPAPAGQSRRHLFLTEVRTDAAPFRVFGDAVWAAVGELRFNGGLVSRRAEGGLADDVFASYNDRTACLISTTCGAGRLAVLNADLMQSNLPTNPTFVPLIGELIERVLSQGGEEGAAVCGESVGRYLPHVSAGPDELRVLGPEGAAGDYGEILDEGAGLFWRWRRVGLPGVYQIRHQSDVVSAYAAAISPDEADLSWMTPEVLEDRLAGGRSIHYHAASDGGRDRDTMWTYFALGCAACMICELLALRLCKA